MAYYYYRSGTVNLKSFVRKVLFRIKWKFEPRGIVKGLVKIPPDACRTDVGKKIIDFSELVGALERWRKSFHTAGTRVVDTVVMRKSYSV